MSSSAPVWATPLFGKRPRKKPGTTSPRRATAWQLFRVLFGFKFSTISANDSCPTNQGVIFKCSTFWTTCRTKCDDQLQDVALANTLGTCVCKSELLTFWFLLGLFESGPHLSTFYFSNGPLRDRELRLVNLLGPESWAESEVGSAEWGLGLWRNWF